MSADHIQAEPAPAASSSSKAPILTRNGAAAVPVRSPHGIDPVMLRLSGRCMADRGGVGLPRCLWP